MHGPMCSPPHGASARLAPPIGNSLRPPEPLQKLVLISSARNSALASQGSERRKGSMTLLGHGDTGRTHGDDGRMLAVPMPPPGMLARGSRPPAAGRWVKFGQKIQIHRAANPCNNPIRCPTSLLPPQRAMGTAGIPPAAPLPPPSPPQNNTYPPLF